jgi:hypothetical protein
MFLRTQGRCLAGRTANEGRRASTDLQSAKAFERGRVDQVVGIKRVGSAGANPEGLET